MSTHVVLLGDSIFDNAAYVPGEPPVEAQLREAMPDARVTLLAVDGATTIGVPSQLARLPRDATHLVLSVGGNDALGHIDILTRPTSSVGDALRTMTAIGEDFERAYRRVLDAVVARGLPTIVCTIYYPAFDEPGLQRAAIGAVAFFNDAILRAAFDHVLPVVDLRMVCNERAHYANPIEPSALGGARISATIARAVDEFEAGRAGAPVYGHP